MKMNFGKSRLVDGNMNPHYFFYFLHLIILKSLAFLLIYFLLKCIEMYFLTLSPTVFSWRNWLLMTWSTCTCPSLWVKNWLDCWAQRVKVNGIQSSWQLVASGISCDLAPGLVCFTFLLRILRLQMMSTPVDTLTCSKIGRFSRGIWIDKYDGPNPVTWCSTGLSARS